MINPCTLSDRALKILIILWQAATALSTDQIMATYAQKVGKYSIRIALMELEGKQLVSRLGYRDGWMATPGSRQMILGEVLPTSTSTPGGVVVVNKIREENFQREITTPTAHKANEVLPTSTSSDPKIEDRYYKALRAGQVWTNTAHTLAKRLASGEINLSTLDVIAIVEMVNKSSVDNIGAVVRHHVENANLADSRYYAPTDDINDAIQWLSQNDRERKAHRNYLDYLED